MRIILIFHKSNIGLVTGRIFIFFLKKTSFWTVNNGWLVLVKYKMDTIGRPDVKGAVELEEDEECQEKTRNTGEICIDEEVLGC